jgi:hypothetical protein
MLIGMALSKNTELRNLLDTLFLKNVWVEGVFGDQNQGRPAFPASEARKALLLGLRPAGMSLRNFIRRYFEGTAESLNSFRSVRRLDMSNAKAKIPLDKKAVSRRGSYDTAYFAKKHGLSLKDALRIIKTHGSDRDAADRAAQRFHH